MISIYRSFVSDVLVVTFVSTVSFRFDGFVLVFRILVHAAAIKSVTMNYIQK